MTTYKPTLKVGVLNMTIAFDRTSFHRKMQKKTELTVNLHPTSCFVPRNKVLSQRYNSTHHDKEDKLSPYQHYRKSHKESIKLIKKHQ